MGKIINEHILQGKNVHLLFLRVCKELHLRSGNCECNVWLCTGCQFLSYKKCQWTMRWLMSGLAGHWDLKAICCGGRRDSKFLHSNEWRAAVMIFKCQWLQGRGNPTVCHRRRVWGRGGEELEHVTYYPLYTGVTCFKKINLAFKVIQNAILSLQK